MNFLKKHFLLAATLIGFTGHLGHMIAQADCCLVTFVDMLSIEGATYTPSTLAISPTGSCFAVASGGGITSFALNSSCTPSLRNTIGTDFTAAITGLAYSSTGSCLGAGAAIASPEVAIFPVLADCSLSTTSSFDNFNEVIAFSSLNCVGQVGAGGGPVIFQSLNTTSCALTGNNTSNFPSPAGAYTQAAFSPTGSCFAAIDIVNNRVCTIGVSSCVPAAIGTAQSLPATPTYLAFSPSGCLAVVTSDGSISLFTINSSTCVLTPVVAPINLGIDNPIQASFSADGTCLAIAYQGTRTQGVNLYSFFPETCTMNTNPSQQLNTSGNPVRGAGFTANGCLVVITDGEIFTYAQVPLAQAMLTASPQPVCDGATLTLLASPSSGPFEYTFIPPTGPAIPNGSNPVKIITGVTPSDEGNWSVLITGEGCESQSEPITVTVIECAPSTTLELTECCPRLSCSDVATYLISITNTGETSAINVKLVDTLASCLTFLSATSEDPWSPFTVTDQQVSGALSLLAAGATTTVTITAQAHCCRGHKIFNSAVVSASNVTTPQTAHCCTKVD